jgi:endoglucanase
MRKKIYQLIVVVVFALLYGSQLTVAQGYLHRSAKVIVDGDNNEVILKGLNFGNSMVQEGYIMNTSSTAGTQHEIKAKLRLLIGDSLTNVFYKAWLNNHVSQADIDSIKSWGMNSVRIPIHYEYFTKLDEDIWYDWGFEFLDSIVKWCSKSQIYAIIDLHATPGGQGTNASISDYDSSKPSLWESMANKNKTVALWGKIAERYANEPWVGGYDLINETNNTTTFPMGSKNDSLLALFKRITTAIRAVDMNHIIFIEGNDFANDFDGLTPAWDDNLVYSFHKYWSNNDAAAISKFVTLRNSTNCPIWCGETGENSNYHFTKEMELFATYGIGSCWWLLKKFESTTSFASANWSSGYNSILNYWKTGTSKPDTATAFQGLMELAENLKIQNCKINRDVIHAIMIQPDNTTKNTPFVPNTIPGNISFSDYDMGLAGNAYSNTVVEDLHSSTGVDGVWNAGGAYRNDGVGIQKCTDAVFNNGFSVGWTNDKQWMNYTVNVDSSALYDVVLRIASPYTTGLLHLEVNGKDVSGTVSVPNTGGWSVWSSYTIKDIYIEKGVNTLKIFVDKAGFNLNAMLWSQPKEIVEIPTRILSAATDADGKKITLVFNNKLKGGQSINASDFIISTTGGILGNTAPTVSIAEIALTDTNQVVLSVNGFLSFDQTIKLTYNGTSLIDTNSVKLSTFLNQPVLNKMPTRYYLPGKVEAENYSKMVGMTTEKCEDTGTGFDLGYIDVNDYAEYLVFAKYDTTYVATYRTAGASVGKGQLSLMDGGVKTFLSNATTINTGGWQTWASYESKDTFRLSKGPHLLRYTITTSGYNFNYFSLKIVKQTAATSNPSVTSNAFSVYPNPTNGLLNVQTNENSYKVEIFNIAGKLVYRKTVDSGFDGTKLDITNEPKGLYLLKVTSKNNSAITKIIKE